MGKTRSNNSNPNFSKDQNLMEGGTKISNFKHIDFFSFLTCELRLKQVSSCWYGADYANDMQLRGGSGIAKE